MKKSIQTGSFSYSQILECVSSLIKSEQELEVKRAAVVVLSSILQGLGPHALKVELLLHLQSALGCILQFKFQYFFQGSLME